MTDPHLIALEEQISHQQRVIDELSEMVRRQGADIDRLHRRVALLLERAAEAEAQGSGSAVIGDQPPPHY